MRRTQGWRRRARAAILTAMQGMPMNDAATPVTDPADAATRSLPQLRLDPARPALLCLRATGERAGAAAGQPVRRPDGQRVQHRHAGAAHDPAAVRQARLPHRRILRRPPGALRHPGAAVLLPVHRHVLRRPPVDRRCHLAAQRQRERSGRRRDRRRRHRGRGHRATRRDAEAAGRGEGEDPRHARGKGGAEVGFDVQIDQARSNADTRLKQLREAAASGAAPPPPMEDNFSFGNNGPWDEKKNPVHLPGAAEVRRRLVQPEDRPRQAQRQADQGRTRAVHRCLRRRDPDRAVRAGAAVRADAEAGLRVQAPPVHGAPGGGAAQPCVHQPRPAAGVRLHGAAAAGAGRRPGRRLPGLVRSACWSRGCRSTCC